MRSLRRIRDKIRMAIYHLSAKPVQRSQGRSGTAAAAYRAGVCLKDERTGETHDYTRKQGVEHSEIMTPNEENIDRERLWNLAEESEKRKDGTPAREYEIALPDELDEKQHLELARSFAGYLAKRHGCAVDLAVHAPGKDGDHRNHHAHLLCTTRRFEPGGRLGEKCDVELSDRARAKKGLPGRKAELDTARAHWERLVNHALEKAGRPERIDRRSLSEQGLKRKPGIHLGPTATAMERRGIQTDRGDHNRQIQKKIEVAEWSQSRMPGFMEQVRDYREDRARAAEAARRERERAAKAAEEEKAKLQKEKEAAEKARARSHRGQGMGR